jgi:putative (di)nucleoside polyphosphate hydrolase
MKSSWCHVIDADGYRPNVGIILSNHENMLLWARRIGQHAWQFPQGGIREHESPQDALYRELWEEIGLKPEHVEIIGQTREWLRYKLPKRLVRRDTKPVCIGQKQIWFLLRLTTSEQHICFDCTETPEFDHWQWVDYWHPLSEVVAFKRDVYKNALEELEPLYLSLASRAAAGGKR